MPTVKGHRKDKQDIETGHKTHCLVHDKVGVKGSSHRGAVQPASVCTTRGPH